MEQHTDPITGRHTVNGIGPDDRVRNTRTGQTGTMTFASLEQDAHVNVDGLPPGPGGLPHTEIWRLGEVERIDEAERSTTDDDLVVAPAAPVGETGFLAPVLITRAVWDDCIEWTNADHVRTGALQDQDGRLWDVLHMAARAVRTMQQRHGDAWSEAVFQVWRVARDARPGEDGDIESAPVFLAAARSAEGITISRANAH
jgi:hypothetical protein